MGARKDLYKVKGLLLVPINWDTLKPRKQKMEVWSKDTTKKEENLENQEKKETGYQVFVELFLNLGNRKWRSARRTKKKKIQKIQKKGNRISGVPRKT